MNESQNQQDSQLKKIQDSLDFIAKKLGEQERRLSILEGGNASLIKNISVQAPLPPPPPSSVDHAYQPSSSVVVPAWENEAVATKLTQSGGNLEEQVGGKWFARIGIMALVIGISFFLKYAFDNNWIGPAGRVAIGIVAGMILLGIGEKTIRKYSMYGQMVSGGGIAVLYLSIFAAFSFYSLISQIPAFFFMMVITTVGIMLSLRYDALSLFIVSTLGGFATPFLISTGKNEQIALFTYVAILDLAILAVSVFKKWREVNIIGFTGTFILFLTWFSEFYSEDQLFSTMFFLTLFFLIYSLSSSIYNLVKKEKSAGIEQMLTIFAAVTYFGASYGMLNDHYHDFMGFFALIMGIYYFLWAYLVRELTPEDDNLYNFLATLTVGFVTLAIPIQFKQHVITIGWLIEAAVLFVLGMKVKKQSILAFATMVLGLASMRIMTLDSAVSMKEYVFLFNKSFFTIFIAVAVAYFLMLMAKMLMDEDQIKSFSRKGMMMLFLIMANWFTIFGISREIILYYDYQASKVNEIYNKQIESTGGYRNNNSSYDSSLSKVRFEKLDKLESRSSVTLSVFWLIYGIILMTAGIFSRNKVLRVGGLLLLTLAILKLFFYDLWNLGQLYRIVSSITLGVVLLLISFAYQKYKDKIKEVI